jgi:hypothetical protein
MLLQLLLEMLGMLIPSTAGSNADGAAYGLVMPFQLMPGIQLVKLMILLMEIIPFKLLYLNDLGSAAAGCAAALNAAFPGSNEVGDAGNADTAAPSTAGILLVIISFNCLWRGWFNWDCFF